MESLHMVSSVGEPEKDLGLNFPVELWQSYLKVNLELAM